MVRQWSPTISRPLRSTRARSVDVVDPSGASHNPARAMDVHGTTVSAGHGETSADTAANRNPTTTTPPGQKAGQLSANPGPDPNQSCLRRVSG